VASKVTVQRISFGDDNRPLRPIGAKAARGVMRIRCSFAASVRWNVKRTRCALWRETMEASVIKVSATHSVTGAARTCRASAPGDEHRIVASGRNCVHARPLLYDGPSAPQRRSLADDLAAGKSVDGP
jgi:hypothetical protein